MVPEMATTQMTIHASNGGNPKIVARARFTNGMPARSTTAGTAANQWYGWSGEGAESGGGASSGAGGSDTFA